MKRVFRVMILTILAVHYLVACSGKPESDSISESSVKVRIPWQDEQGEFKLQLVELAGLSSLYDMGGKFARFFFAPGISDGHLVGKGPRGRYLSIGNNTYIPQNEISQSMASIYAHMQRLAALDKKLGVGDVNKWPRDVGVNVQVKGDAVLRENNAFYDGLTDSFFFVPFKSESLPIAVNPGVIAHEHFHSLFFKLVIKGNEKISKSDVMRNASNHDAEAYYNAMKLEWNTEGTHEEQDNTVTQLANSFYHVAILRGLNEGLADFWGWVYTGDDEFILHSFPREKQRSLKAEQQDVLSRKTIEWNASIAAKYGRSTGTKKIRSVAYVIGTNYARIFKQFAELYQSENNLSKREAREKVAVMVLKVLPEFSREFGEALGSSEPYEPTHIFHSFADINDLTQKECEFFADVVTYTTRNSYACGQQGSAWRIKFFEEEKANTTLQPVDLSAVGTHQK